MPNIISPNGNRVVPLSQITKGQLAKIVNDQSESLRREIQQRKQLVTVLATIVRDPEAFTASAAGSARVTMAAINACPNGITINMRVIGDDLVLTTVDPGPAGPQPSRIIVPKIGLRPTEE